MNEPAIRHETESLGSRFHLKVIANRMPSITNDDELIYCHWHRNMEFILIEGGTAVVTVDSRRYQANDGDLVFINPGEVHTAHTHPRSTTIAFAIVFDPVMLPFRSHDICHDSVISPLMEGAYRLPTHLTPQNPWHSRISEEVRGIVQADAAKTPGHELYMKACIYKVLSIITSAGLMGVQGAAAPTARRDRTELLKGVIRYMEENHTSAVRVGELAGMAGLSEDHFYKAFKGLTGKTPVSYMNGYRVSRAIRLMSEKGAGVTEAALEVGFENISYFIRVFRKHTGMTPARYMAGRIPKENHGRRPYAQG